MISTYPPNLVNGAPIQVPWPQIYSRHERRSVCSPKQKSGGGRRRSPDTQDGCQSIYVHITIPDSTWQAPARSSGNISPRNHPHQLRSINRVAMSRNTPERLPHPTQQSAGPAAHQTCPCARKPPVGRTSRQAVLYTSPGLTRCMVMWRLGHLLFGHFLTQVSQAQVETRHPIRAGAQGPYSRPSPGLIASSLAIRAR